MNIFHPHATIDELAEYLAGDLSLLRRAELEGHLVVCSRCAGELAGLKHLIELMRTDMAEDAPPSLIERAVRLFRSRTSNTSPSSGFPGRVLAMLRFDSQGLAPAFGVRSGKPSARQLLFNAGSEEIDLRIEPVGQTWTVSGQILGQSPAGGTAVLQGSAGTIETALNELSEFVLTEVAAGTYRLILKLLTVEIETDEIRIGP